MCDRAITAALPVATWAESAQCTPVVVSALVEASAADAAKVSTNSAKGAHPPSAFFLSRCERLQRRLRRFHWCKWCSARYLHWTSIKSVRPGDVQPFPFAAREGYVANAAGLGRIENVLQPAVRFKNLN